MSVSPRRRWRAGDHVPVRELRDIRGVSVAVPDPDRLVHLQFRRFAGCPVCNLHLQAMVRRAAELTAAGIKEVVLFHSPPEELARHAGDLPFAVVADPDKRLYLEFGVEAAPRALLDPRAWPTIVRAVVHSGWEMIRDGRPAPALVPHGGRYGLPADFLIAPDGRVLAVKYGEHADDQWPVEDVLVHAAAAHQGPSGTLRQIVAPTERPRAAHLQLARQGFRHALLVLALTSVHHAYGAYAYDTPWRLHAIPVAAVTSLVMLGLVTLAARVTSARWAHVALAAFVVISLLVPVGLFGFYEGGFNHVLKNVLYFSGASRSTLDWMYDPALYAWPDDAFFEGTGILQFVPALLAAVLLFRLVQCLRQPLPVRCEPANADAVPYSAFTRARRHDLEPLRDSGCRSTRERRPPPNDLPQPSG